MMETLAVKEPSMLKTTASVPRATTVRQHSAYVWSPLRPANGVSGAGGGLGSPDPQKPGLPGAHLTTMRTG